jgi:hypothetical protein
MLKGMLPGSRLGAIGFSLGGNVLMLHLGQIAEAACATLRACVAVSVPYDLAECERALDSTPMGRWYVRVFLRTLKQKAEAKAGLLPPGVDLERIRAARTFREFDDAATAPLHGYAGADDYYARASSAPVIDHIRVPTLLVQAEDDPFLPASAIPFAAISANPCLQPVVTPHGGHVGFIGGAPWSPLFWVEREAARFLAQWLLAEQDPA